MENRLLIKSAMLTYSQDVFIEATHDENGQELTPRELAHAELGAKAGDAISHVVKASTIEITINGVKHTRPIPASAERYRGRS